MLKCVSFSIAPGEMIGIVGRSGSGKTTLVNLLGRFYDVDDGRIVVDGADVRDYPLAELHRRIGIVFQESYLFRGTIWENLTYGRPEATIESGLQAARAAGAHDFILRSALSYETVLGENGAGLSGGEKQRLSIARALLYDPPILVLDEATSSVDTETERGIQEALERLAKNRTTIAIAHRLSTLRNASRILVFDRGRLAEEGTHAALLAMDGTYAKLVRIQTQLGGPANVDRLVEKLDAAETAIADDQGANSNAAIPEPEGDSASAVRWLDPAATRAWRDAAGRLCVAIDGKEFIGALCVRCFPATMPDECISIRHWNSDGDEVELGVVRRLADWPRATQQLIGEALSRRYLLRRVERIDAIEFRHGYLWIRGRIDAAQGELCMRWSQNQALEFGPRGKLLIDVDDNRFLVHDVAALPYSEQQLFRRYIYW